MSVRKRDVLGYDRNSLRNIFQEMGESAYRAEQMMDWIYRRQEADFSRMTNFSQTLIKRLQRNYQIGSLECAETLRAEDGTAKYLWRLHDGHTIETVLIPAGRRKTVCLSSQAGCRFHCPFCASGSKGFFRQLETAEMVGQVTAVQRLSGVTVTHVVFMGIGEPLDNFENVTGTIRILNDSRGLRIGARRITVSTCGLVPGIEKLQGLGLQVELSVSLHAVNDRLRDRLVPVNREYNLNSLLAACRRYREATGRVVTFEYALIEGVNDADEDAVRLGDLSRSMKAKVNLIPCSPVLSGKFRGTSRQNLCRFSDTVRNRGAEITIRRSRGSEIQAACGQLALDRDSRLNDKS